MDISKIMSISIGILLILVALLSVTYKFGDCNKCTFDYQGMRLNSNEFMRVYVANCSVVSSVYSPEEIDFINISVQKEE